MVETVSRQGLSQGVFPCCMCPWEPHLTGTHWICYGHMGATGSHWHRLGTGSHGLSLGPHGVMAPMGSHGVISLLIFDFAQTCPMAALPMHALVTLVTVSHVKEPMYVVSCLKKRKKIAFAHCLNHIPTLAHCPNISHDIIS